MALPSSNDRNRLFCLAVACGILLGGEGCQSRTADSAKSATAKSAQGATPTSVKTDHLHNVYQLTPRLYSGSAPESEAAFLELKRLGVRTIISVDGSKPHIAEARAHGMRYIHLPIGYDGVPKERQLALIQAYQTIQGPLFLHCHHGKHRGPAAAAVICEGAVGWNVGQAVKWMELAGTGKDYAGLYTSASNFTPPTPEQLKKRMPLPELAPTSSLVESMVAIDTTQESLKRLRQASWKPLPGLSRSPEESALLMWEHWKELRRLPGVDAKPESFQALLAASESHSFQLLEALKANPVNTKAGNAHFDSLSRACADCHRQFRN